jgi:hypothetical protein
MNKKGKKAVVFLMLAGMLASVVLASISAFL